MAGKPLPIPVKIPSKSTTGKKEDLIQTVEELEKAGSSKLSRLAREFYNHGSMEQETLHDNATAFSQYRLRPRVLVDVSGVDTSTTVFGNRIRFPLCMSPTGLQAMAHPDGDLATSRACARNHLNMGISSFANYPIHRIVEQGRDGKSHDHHHVAYAIQMYMYKDREMQASIVRTAEASGCKAILLTADSPVLGVRLSERRNDFRTPEGLGFPILGKTTEEIRGRGHENQFKEFADDSHNWTRDIPWLRSLTKMQIWIKGVLTAEDTLKAIEYGCDGVLVSNHGGRQLDGVPATLDALVECVEAAQGRIPIHVDGGFRRGSDIFRALALGADCCWVGRPILWGLAYNGEAGVDLTMRILYEEFKRCMQLMGCRTVKDIKRSCLGRKNAATGRLEKL